jgi:Flp pilus assembly protein TadD
LAKQDNSRRSAISPRFQIGPALAAAGMALLAYLLYRPALGHAFLNYDDDLYITRNPNLRLGLSWRGIAWAFTTFHGANWFPLTWLSWLLDYSVFGLDARGFHLGNVLLHALNAALLFLALRRLTGAFGPSLFAAAVFAAHPLHVESVAWAAVRKDVLSGLFFVLCLWLYARYASRPSRARLAGVAMCMLLGVMAKPVLVTLPALLLLLDVWPLGRLSWGEPSVLLGRVRPLLAEKGPLFAVAAAASGVTFVAQRSQEAVQSFEAFPPWVRGLNAIQSYAAYLQSAFWPANLSVYYPHPGEAIGALSSAAAAAVVCAATLSAWRLRRSHPWLLSGWGWFVVALIPMIGLIQVGEQARADRYMYVPLIGLSLALGVEARVLAAASRLANALPVLACAVVLGLAALTQRQLGYWRDSETLFRRALAVTHANAVAHLNLGVALLEKGATATAIENLRAALRLQAGSAEAHAALGEALARSGAHDEAAQHLSTAVRLDDRLSGARNALGRLLAETGRTDEALTQFQEAISSEPTYAEPYNNLGSMLLAQGSVSEAIEYFKKAVSLDPNYGEPLANWGLALLRRGEVDEAVVRLRRALALEPQLVNARASLAFALASRRSFQEAATHYREALRMKPDDPELNAGMALTLAHLSRFRDALPYFEAAARLRPDDPEIQTSWGMALASVGDDEQALARYRAALGLEPEYADAHNALGMLEGRQGRLQDALRSFSKALSARPDHAQALNNKGLALARLGRLQEAAEQLREAVRRAPDYADAHNNLGVLLAQLGRFEEAAAQFRRTLELDPERADARANLDKLRAAPASPRSDPAGR